jgi:hypothetical protein
MAFRLLVSYKNLKATVDLPSSQASLSKAEPKSVTTFVEASADSQYSLAQFALTFTELQSTLLYVNLSAVNVRLDPDSKNVYFTTGSPNAVSVTMQEEHLVTFGKQVTDTVSILEAIAKSTSFSVVSENIGLSEDLDILLEFLRSFSDTASISDVPQLLFETASSDIVSLGENSIFNLNTIKQDNLSLAEDLFFSASTSLTDTFGLIENTDFFIDVFAGAETVSISESLIISEGVVTIDSISISENYTSNFGLAKSDSVSLSEVLARVVTFNRVFSDTFTLDDLASVQDPLQTDVDLDKENVTFMSEELLYIFSKPFLDTFALNEVSTILSTLGKTDSISIAETLTRVFNPVKTDSVGISEFHAYSFSTSASDSATITESLALKFIQSRTINSAALNTNALN